MTEVPAPRLWTRGFLFLWQGQLVSHLGDVIYEIALGFWILAVTGSTAMMGSLMAASALPRIFVAPFAGVLVDRSERKWLLVSMDLMRGVAVVLVGVAALFGVIRVWMVFAGGIIIGLGGAVFGPAVGSALPDIIPREKLVQGNSVFQLIGTGSGIVGSSAGGILFQVLGAPLMFLLNGISYLVSAATLVFVPIPRIVRQRPPQRFFADMKDGLALVWNSRGLRALFLIAAALNFFASFGIVLFLPLFQKSAELGAARFGVAMGCFAGGLFLGFLTSSTLPVPPRKRFAVFMLCGFAMGASLAAFPLIHLYALMVPVLVIAGFLNAVINACIPATLQAVVPQDMRGKAFSLINSMAMSLSPIAMALGGVLAEFVPIRTLIALSFAAMLLSFVPLLFSPPVKALLNFDPAVDLPESVLS